jgi:hypothetical protein
MRAEVPHPRLHGPQLSPHTRHHDPVARWGRDTDQEDHGDSVIGVALRECDILERAVQTVTEQAANAGT